MPDAGVVGASVGRSPDDVVMSAALPDSSSSDAPAAPPDGGRAADGPAASPAGVAEALPAREVGVPAAGPPVDGTSAPPVGRRHGSDEDQPPRSGRDHEGVEEDGQRRKPWGGVGVSSTACPVEAAAAAGAS